MQLAGFPLEGVRVLDFGSAIATPSGTKTLAILGAEVIKIESTKRLDISRFGAYVDNKPTGEFWNKCGRYNTHNTNKKSLTLDLSVLKGRQIAIELVKVSDVVTENWAPRVKVNLGLDYPELAKVKPDIILISASGYGATGRCANWIAWGMALDPMCGLSYLTGFPDGLPVKGSPPMTDSISASYVTLAALAALEYRRRTGKGQWIDLSEYETGTLHNGPALMDFVMNGRVKTRLGNRHEVMAPYGCYRCKGQDSWVTIAVANDTQWRRLCEAMGKPELAADTRFATTAGRYQAQDELDKLVEEWTLTLGHYAVMNILQEKGVNAAAVLNMKELLLDPQTKARNSYPLVEHPKAPDGDTVGTHPYPGIAWRTQANPIKELEAAPRLGAHNHYVLHDILKIPETEIAKLYQQGIIGEKPFVASDTKAVARTADDIDQMLEEGVIVGYDPDFRKILGTE
jgi:crotonobetainyl-CoA:carnitine CoA-transferase CaiB-like acyl-CoA transferase